MTKRTTKTRITKRELADWEMWEPLWKELWTKQGRAFADYKTDINDRGPVWQWKQTYIATGIAKYICSNEQQVNQTAEVVKLFMKAHGGRVPFCKEEFNGWLLTLPEGQPCYGLPK